MLGLSRIGFLGSYLMGSVVAAFIAERIMSALFSGAHEAVHSVVFRRGIRSDRDDGSNG